MEDKNKQFNSDQQNSNPSSYNLQYQQNSNQDHADSKLDLRKIPASPELFRPAKTDSSVVGVPSDTSPPDKIGFNSFETSSDRDEVLRKSSKSIVDDESFSELTQPAGANYQSLPVSDKNNQFEQQAQQTRQNLGSQPVQALVQKHESSSPGLLVLQWLTYAFWGWLAIGLSILTPITFSSFFEHSSSDVNGVIYGIAAVIILTIIAGTLDFFYYKKEIEPKVGASAAVMVIHAVIYGLFNVGWLIALVFLLINTLIGDDKDMMSTFICTSLVMIVFYALLLVRALDFRKGKYKKPAIITLLSITVVIILLAIIGPVVKSVATKNDRLIESNLISLTTLIEDYTAKNNNLPKDLKTVINSSNSGSSSYYLDNAEKLVSKNLVEYTANTKPKIIDMLNVNANHNSADLTNFKSQNLGGDYYYELCVMYARENKQGYSKSRYDGSYMRSGDLYSYLNNHPSGKTCYKIIYADYGY